MKNHRLEDVFMKGRQSMAVKQIPRLEFDQLFPDRHVLEGFTGALVECFINDAKDILGGVDHQLEDDWSYVVMKRNQNGEFRVVNLNANIEKKSEAEAALLREMQKAETK
jgi:hypothetical protein